jgi:hypothetical protein
LLANGRVDVVAQLPPTLERRRQLELFRVAPVRSSASHAMIFEKVKWRRRTLTSQITDVDAAQHRAGLGPDQSQQS